MLAAFLGGSLAAGTATPESDVDVYVIVREEDYEALWARRHELIRASGEPVSLEDHPNFDGLGFDLVWFEFADGVRGEIAFARRGNMLAMHGGPYAPLHDPEGVLSGVVFPLR